MSIAIQQNKIDIKIFFWLFLPKNCAKAFRLSLREVRPVLYQIIKIFHPWGVFRNRTPGMAFSHNGTNHPAKNAVPNVRWRFPKSVNLCRKTKKNPNGPEICRRKTWDRPPFHGRKYLNNLTNKNERTLNWLLNFYDSCVIMHNRWGTISKECIRIDQILIIFRFVSLRRLSGWIAAHQTVCCPAVTPDLRGPSDRLFRQQI